MRKVVFLAIALLLTSAPESNAWCRLGHATIAQIAENHVSRRTLRKVGEYLNGQSMAEVATDPDTYRGAWAMDVGFVPVNADEYRYKFMTDFDFNSPKSLIPVSHGVTIKPDGTPYKTDRDGDMYVNNAAYYVESWAKELREKGDKMDPQERYRKLVFIIHLIGDMHCPGHIFFEGRNDIFGKFPVQYRGKEMRYHYFWDYTVFSGNSIVSISDGVKLIDTAGSKERKAVCSGDIWDWVSDCGRQCLPVYEMVPADKVLPYAFAAEVRPVFYKQIRNAGYRLAAVLDEIFK